MKTTPLNLLQQLILSALMIGLAVATGTAFAETGKTLEIRLGADVPRSWNDLQKAGYAYGPKQEFDPGTEETHIWLPYGNKGEYFQTAGVKFTEPGSDTGWPLVLTVDDHTSGRLVFKLHFDKPIGGFRFDANWSEWGVGGNTVGGVEYSVDGQRWTTIRELHEAKAQARIIDQFVDGKKTFGGLNSRDLYIRCYSRDKSNPDAQSGPGRWMKFAMGGNPAWGDAATTFFDRQFQLWVTPATGPTTAVKTNDFLNSIGACTHVRQGEDNPAKVAECLSYIGIRAIRDDGTTDPKILQSFIDIHRASGAKVVLLPINGDIAASLAEYETLAAAGALLAAEGPNEPNNWHVTYKGATSSNKTSLPIARFQADLYAAVKADPKLAGIPVFHSSEAGGSEPDNCGLQFLTIPKGAGALMPDGTKYADYANPHNYVCDHLKGITEDNIAWNAEDPTLKGKWDGLYVEYGHTWWGGGFQRLYQGRVGEAAQGHHRDRLEHPRRRGRTHQRAFRGGAGQAFPEPLSGRVQTGLDLHLRLHVARFCKSRGVGLRPRRLLAQGLGDLPPQLDHDSCGPGRPTSRRASSSTASSTSPRPCTTCSCRRAMARWSWPYGASRRRAPTTSG